MLEIEPQIKTEIVRLRKLGTTLHYIAETTVTSVQDVKSILKKEFGEQYYNYSFLNFLTIDIYYKRSIALF